MYIELGDHEKLNECISTYSDSKTIRIYWKITEKRTDVETLYLQILNILFEKDKIERNKHTN